MNVTRKNPRLLMLRNDFIKRVITSQALFLPFDICLLTLVTTLLSGKSTIINLNIFKEKISLTFYIEQNYRCTINVFIFFYNSNHAIVKCI